MTLIEIASFALIAAGIGIAVLVVATTRNLPSAFAAALELWTAAGLLRLSTEASWASIAVAGALVTTRKVVGFGLLRGRASRRV